MNLCLVIFYQTGVYYTDDSISWKMKIYFMLAHNFHI